MCEYFVTELPEIRKFRFLLLVFQLLFDNTKCWAFAFSRAFLRKHKTAEAVNRGLTVPLSGRTDRHYHSQSDAMAKADIVV